MTDRELMQHALECLEWHIEAGAYGHDIEGTAGLLRALLAEPEQGPMKHGGRPMTLRECMEAEEPAQPEQEPVAWADEIIDDLHAQYNTDGIKEIDSGDALIRLDEAIAAVEEAEKRHTAPPQRKPLTDEEIDRVTDQQWAQNNHKPIYAAHRAYARAVEAAHGIKGNA